MGLWVLLLIRCSTFTILSDVRHITHTCTQQHSPSSVSPSIHLAPPQAEALTLHVSPLLVSLQTDRHCLHRRCCFLRKRTDCLDHTLRRTGSDTTIGSLRELWGPPHRGLNNPTSKRDTTLLPKNFKTICLWALLLIRCSTFTILSDVGHITHTCTQQQ
ncbi:hypothetical protein MTR_0734s0020 [Medicago truncatula]|uniref:Transmembrane protein n=1 Tax=Medicago truncatula TaxID=3880 RepID=A0A072TDH2_MEDTR|nr:hypothetical protein MTR_0734s0020 [Medicago truncatula]